MEQHNDFFDINSPDPAIGIDTGNFEVKAICGNREISFPNITAIFKENKDGIDDDNREVMRYEGKDYVIGENAIKLGADFTPSDTKTTIKTTVTTLYAIAKLCADNNQPIITPWLQVGLPVSTYLTQKTKLNEFMGRMVKKHIFSIGTIKELRSNTARCYQVEIAYNPQQESISRFLVRPEPYGTYIGEYLLYDPKSNRILPDKAVADRKTGIIDIGLGTIDLLWVEHAQPFDLLSRHLPFGINRLYDYIIQEMKKKYKNDRVMQTADIKHTEIVAALSHPKKELICGPKKYYLQPIDTAEDPINPEALAKNRFTHELVEEITNEVWLESNILKLNQLIITGGGGALVFPELYAKLLSKHDDLYITKNSDPRMANANGFFLYALYRKLKSKK